MTALHVAIDQQDEGMVQLRKLMLYMSEAHRYRAFIPLPTVDRVDPVALSNKEKRHTKVENRGIGIGC